MNLKYTLQDLNISPIFKWNLNISSNLNILFFFFIRYKTVKSWLFFLFHWHIMSWNKHEKEYKVENYCYFLLSQGSYTLLHKFFWPFSAKPSSIPKKSLKYHFLGEYLCWTTKNDEANNSKKLLWQSGDKSFRSRGLVANKQYNTFWMLNFKN